MSESLPFRKVKLQLRLEMVTYHEMDDNALRVAISLAFAHADHETGEHRRELDNIVPLLARKRGLADVRQASHAPSRSRGVGGPRRGARVNFDGHGSNHR